MLKKLLGTSGTRVFSAIVSFLILLLATNKLGKEAWGIAAFVVVDASVILLLVEMLAGSGLVYFTPRKSIRTLLKVAYTWIFVMVLVAYFLFQLLALFPSIYTEIIPEGYACDILVVVLLNALHFVNLNVLLGKGKVKQYNILFFVQFATQLLAMLFFIYVLDMHDAYAFIYALYTSFLAPMLPGLVFLYGFVKKEQKKDKFFETFKESIRFGVVIQLSSLVSIINRRLSLFIINKYNGIGSVGVYNSGVQITEGLKLIAQSIALVQFSSISNSNSHSYAVRLTVQLMKLATILTALALLVLISVPRSVFEFVFSKDFGEIKLVIVTLAPAVLCIAANNIFSHFFSGINKPQHNLIGSIIGFFVTIPAALLLIPNYGFIGAGLTTSITFFAVIVYQWVVFRKMTQTRFVDLIPDKSDWKLLVLLSKQMLRK
ncbi:MAG: polysaccharide biosynthesis C-terminal domain-containing protein [Lentimicrobiaceae bacterium]|jgi:O-antigen/teichoic acid export membrane protein|nr:polysaccharide biosynthesis C-terminal domain-containing protein [Lentimicrobiaceae bacterium]